MLSGLGLCWLVRFLPGIAPRSKTDRHRGANRRSVERKANTETRPENPHGKAKGRENPAISASIAPRHRTDPAKDDGADENERVKAHENQE
jgi:hypothetical protein